jgi:hypothetical protein
MITKSEAKDKSQGSLIYRQRKFQEKDLKSENNIPDSNYFKSILDWILQKFNELKQSSWKIKIGIGTSFLMRLKQG